MAIVRTAMGVASDKGIGLSLTIPDVALDGEGSLLVVGLAYDAGAGAPTVTWGPHTLDPVTTQAGGGTVCRVVTHARNGPLSKTNDLVAAWTPSAPTAKAMFATQVVGAAPHDVVAANMDLGSTDPTSGAGVQLLEHDGILFGMYVSEGPESDTVGSLGDGFALGQRAGTTGSPPVSNITIQETWRVDVGDPDAFDPPQPPPPTVIASMTGATARDFCTLLVTFRRAKFAGTGISKSDLRFMRETFEAATPRIPRRNHAFHYNPQTEEWELYAVDDLRAEPAGTKRVARYDIMNGWVVL